MDMSNGANMYTVSWITATGAEIAALVVVEQTPAGDAVALTMADNRYGQSAAMVLARLRHQQYGLVTPAHGRPYVEALLGGAAGSRWLVTPLTPEHGVAAPIDEAGIGR